MKSAGVRNVFQVGLAVKILTPNRMAQQVHPRAPGSQALPCPGQAVLLR
jgi:hypothetical protein